ncbi:MAG TPA: VOC family protein [Puia sp.]|nr:VOC family protein [Puia sp.]
MEYINILHHIGLINSSLERSAAVYEKLGFTLTPLSIPRIVLTPGGEPEPLGAGNRHAIFGNNYLELLGVVDLTRWAEITREQRGPYDLDAPLSRYEGLHVMHFGTEHIEAVKERLDKLGVVCSPVKEFQRNVKTDTGERMMKARTIHFPPKSNPEGLLQIAQHDTPELVFQDRYMHHRNGAVALTEIMVVTETPDSYVVRYEQYTGHQGRRMAKGHFVVDLGLSRIIVVDPGGLEAIIPGCRIPVLPFMAAFTVEVVNLQLVCEVLTGNNVPFTNSGDTVLVYPENACGCAVIFKMK